MPWRPKWLRNHVLWLTYSGGVSGGDLRHHRLFFLGGYPPQNLLTVDLRFLAARARRRCAGIPTRRRSAISSTC